MEIYGSSRGEEPVEKWVEKEESLVVDPPESFLPELVGRITESAPAEPVRLLLSPAAVELVSTDFLLETRIAGGVDRSELRVREADARFDDRLVLTATDAGLLVGIEDQLGLFPIDVDSLAEELRNRYESAWEDADSFSTRAPSREALYATAEEYLPAQFRTELAGAIDGAATLNWRGTPRPPAVALVVAARARCHHYNLCQWAEEVGFTSRSTVARTKQRLENDDIIAVERVPQERGRPRQRIVVADDSLATPNTDAEELVPTLRRRRNE